MLRHAAPPLVGLCEEPFGDSGLRGQEEGEKPEGSAARDSYRACLAGEADDVDGVGEHLDDGGFGDRVGGQGDKVAGRRGDEAGKAARGVQPHETPVAAEVVPARAAEVAQPADERGAHRDRAPDQVVSHSVAHRDNVSGELVPEDERRHAGARMAKVAVQIRAADAAAGHFNERLACGPAPARGLRRAGGRAGRGKRAPSFPRA